MATECDEKTAWKNPISRPVMPNMSSYCFIILIETQSGTRYGNFKEKNFKVFEHSLEILYDVSTIPRGVTTDFLQRYGDIAILAITDGDHPNKFQQWFSTSDADNAKRFAALNSVVSLQDRLKKTN